VSCDRVPSKALIERLLLAERYLKQQSHQGEPPMIRAGFTIESPLTKSRTVVVEASEETRGMGWLLEVHCVPHAQPDIPEHLHLTWTETFEIISGQAHYKLDGTQKTITAGESFVVLPGHLHIHPWNAGETEMIYRQKNRFNQASPEAVQDVLGVFATRADLAREGKVDSQGRPKNPLQLAVTLRILNRHGGYDAHVPIFVQNLIGGTLGRLAEILGYKAVDSKYVNGVA
jgi:mannose-6-phosphate isomerase-like protein (cupin superfamily)